MKKIILFFFTLLIVPMIYAKNHLVYYEPIITKLTGVITVKTYPGAPNYESIKNGDVAETYPFLELNKPIDVHLPPHIRINKNEMDEPVKNMKLIQLVITHKHDWLKVKNGNRVLLTGTLFYWFTGHHHTKVLMSVNTARVLNTANRVSGFAMPGYR